MRNLDRDIEQLALIIEGIWLKTRIQVNLLKRVWQPASSLDASLRAHYADAIQDLYQQIFGARDVLKQSLNLQLSSSTKWTQVKVRYTVKSLKKIVADLEQWQRRFDPSWYLITLLSASNIDETLRVEEGVSSPTRLIEIRKSIRDVSEQRNDSTDSIFKSQDSVTTNYEEKLGTNTYTGEYNGHSILLDRTNYGALVPLDSMKANVRDLGRMLANVEPDSFGLLKCLGALEVQPHDAAEDIHATQFEFILEIPDQLRTPKTLRSLLLSSAKLSLTTRFQLSKQLARSVMFVHTTGFVHKGIRPETMVIFDDGIAEVGPSFLIGFERTRHAHGGTDYKGYIQWDKNMYRHPVRQGAWVEDAYIMQHDIYSLGVCLLEIGLWHSFVQQDSNDSQLHPWSDLGIQDAISHKDPRHGGFLIKDKLVDITKDRLPSLVGDIYTRLVLACLCCLDVGSEYNVFEDSKSGVKDTDGIVVGVRYIENVRARPGVPSEVVT